MKRFLAAICATTFGATVAHACIMCGSMGTRSTLRQEITQAKYVYVGTLSNPRMSATGIANASATDFTVKEVIKSDASKKTQKQFTIPRYVPVDPKSPAEYLVFCEEGSDGRLDVYRDTQVNSPAVIEYLRGALQIDGKDADKLLAYAGKHLDHADPVLATEAFMEFAKATDADVQRSAKLLSPDMLRRLIDNPKTPAERLGLFISLLGASGNQADAQRFKTLLAQPGERFRGSAAGLYAGLVMLQPTEGWTTLKATLADPKKSYSDRMAALTALRFFYLGDPKAVREHVVTGLKPVLNQNDFADFAIEDLRKWQIWDLSNDVLALYGRKGYEAPIMRLAILRHALCCPSHDAKALVAKVRTERPDSVKDAEESIELERLPAQSYNSTSR